MTDRKLNDEGTITFTDEGRATRADLMLDGRSVSRLWIVPFRIRIGAAVVRMDGIGGVGTDEEYRKRGYSRLVLEATVRHMLTSDAAISMLYGIPDFYPKFGYATAGPDYSLSLRLDTSPALLPAGWTVRPVAPSDLESLRLLYDAQTARATGAAVRRPESGSWSRVAKVASGSTEDECRVIVRPSGEIGAYAWRAKGFWYPDGVAKDHPDALVLGEIVANDPAAADALLAACRLWAAEESARREEPVRRVLTGLPPQGPVASAAMRQSARIEHRYSRCGNSMARLLSVERLLSALQPEMSERLRTCLPSIHGHWRFETEVGAATLTVADDEVRVESGSSPAADRAKRIALPQAELARLALGVFPPDDLLARLEEPLEAGSQRLLEVLFPMRHPHMSLPDRY